MISYGDVYVIGMRFAHVMPEHLFSTRGRQNSFPRPPGTAARITTSLDPAVIDVTRTIGICIYYQHPRRYCPTLHFHCRGRISLRETPNLTMLKSEYLAIIATLILTIFIYFRIRKRSTPPLPPGPKKLPLLGNLFDFPTSREWLTYAKLCKEHSMP